MRHPPFARGPASGRDYCDKDGARALAAMIRAAWTSCGYDVEVVVERGYNTGSDDVLHVVRMPTLINGLPAKIG